MVSSRTIPRGDGLQEKAAVAATATATASTATEAARKKSKKDKAKNSGVNVNVNVDAADSGRRLLGEGFDPESTNNAKLPPKSKTKKKKKKTQKKKNDNALVTTPTPTIADDSKKAEANGYAGLGANTDVDANPGTSPTTIHSGTESGIEGHDLQSSSTVVSNANLGVPKTKAKKKKKKKNTTEAATSNTTATPSVNSNLNVNAIANTNTSSNTNNYPTATATTSSNNNNNGDVPLISLPFFFIVSLVGFGIFWFILKVTYEFLGYSWTLDAFFIIGLPLYVSISIVVLVTLWIVNIFRRGNSSNSGVPLTSTPFIFIVSFVGCGILWFIKQVYKFFYERTYGKDDYYFDEYLEIFNFCLSLYVSITILVLMTLWLVNITRLNINTNNSNNNRGVPMIAVSLFLTLGFLVVGCICYWMTRMHPWFYEIEFLDLFYWVVAIYGGFSLVVLTTSWIINLRRRKNTDFHTHANNHNMKFPPDSYSFVAFYSLENNADAFCLGIFVFLFQSSFFILMILSVVYPPWRTTGEVDNPGSESAFWMFWAEFIPSNAEGIVKITQFLAILSSLVFPEASLLDISKAIQIFPHLFQKNENERIWNVTLSCILRFIQGFLAVIAVFLLVITSSDVTEIVLNFTAVSCKRQCSVYDNNCCKNLLLSFQPFLFSTTLGKLHIITR